MYSRWMLKSWAKCRGGIIGGPANTSTFIFCKIFIKNLLPFSWCPFALNFDNIQRWASFLWTTVEVHIDLRGGHRFFVLLLKFTLIIFTGGHHFLVLLFKFTLIIFRGGHHFFELLRFTLIIFRGGHRIFELLLSFTLIIFRGGHRFSELMWSFTLIIFRGVSVLWITVEVESQGCQLLDPK